jgi:hypothetical protein
VNASQDRGVGDGSDQRILAGCGAVGTGWQSAALPDSAAFQIIATQPRHAYHRSRFENNQVVIQLTDDLRDAAGRSRFENNRVVIQPKGP